MGIFDATAGVFATYHVELQFRDKIMGGIPKDAKIIEGWLRSKAGITQERELREALVKTILDNGGDVNETMTYEQLSAAAEKLSLHRNTNGFKVDEHGLYIEGRYIKAAVKESTNILFAGGAGWGPTRKGPKNYVAERVFVCPGYDHISLGVMEPDGIDLFIGHVTGPSGPQSNLTHVEYVFQPRIQFDIMVTQDGVEAQNWPQIWVSMQEIGLGALRSQGFGRFDIEVFDRLTSSVHVPAARRNGRAALPSPAVKV